MQLPALDGDNELINSFVCYLFFVHIYFLRMSDYNSNLFFCSQLAKRDSKHLFSNSLQNLSLSVTLYIPNNGEFS